MMEYDIASTRPKTPNFSLINPPIDAQIVHVLPQLYHPSVTIFFSSQSLTESFHGDSQSLFTLNLFSVLSQCISVYLSVSLYIYVIGYP